MNPSPSSAVRTVGLRKVFGSTTALAGVDLEVPAGSVYGVIGPNGAGKTTLLRLLLDLLRPTSGQIRVLGVDPRLGGPGLRRRIGYLPGELNVEPRVTGRELLRFYARISGPVDPATVAALAERLDVDLSRPVRNLSKGNKQKLGLLQAFMHRPPLLILDEPTSGLDPLVQQEFLALLNEARDAGQTVLLSSHVLSEIEQAADRVAILRSGRVVAAATTEAVRASASRRVRVATPPGSADALRNRLAAVPGFDVGQLTGGPAVEEGPTTLHGRFDGDIPALVGALAGQPISDLVIEEPDLEDAVLRFYADPAGEPGASGKGAEAEDAPREGPR
ncbi:Daunorubicin/doxorubicin resistance ATP-binding protein DrrA [Arthrobacter saudimassiliensis]|uniref:Daunorubicin/doxorubicin resistance ATP-binding protein DrrA n=1 Tax=Arthrobacter saudimassiliensis TaxID=1461584 RepID=A0A078MSB0_9MICC|nr:Daunorubicin/doxorubicin resistance ATP-binding protein DrrA [Arthrobacter saudimassiliensis]